jgi:hypothetical protein
MKLKIFSDTNYLAEKFEHPTVKYVPMLYPFWGKLPENPDDFRTGRFDKYVEVGDSFLEMTSLQEADLVVFPGYWHLVQKNEEARNLAIQFLEMAKQAGKRVAIFSIEDWQQDTSIKDTIVFYTSSFRSRRKPNEFAMPEWSSDFIGKELSGQLPIRQKKAKPTVGFCGYAPPMGLPFGMKKLKAFLRMAGDIVGLTKTKLFSYRTGHTTRVRALYTLSKSPLVETNFIFRENFAFSNKALQGVPSERLELARRLRLEFCQNIIDSDYVFCASGYENYSIRFYETLSFGRIPVFIDTDCVLPYDFAIDWKKYCVWVNESELHLIADKVADFHSKLSAQEFVDLQYECRRIWQQWISPEGFFANLYQHLQHIEDTTSSPSALL